MPTVHAAHVDAAADAHPHGCVSQWAWAMVLTLGGSQALGITCVLLMRRMLLTGRPHHGGGGGDGGEGSSGTAADDVS